MPIKSVKMKISKNKINAFVSHVSRITQSKNLVPRSKGVLCSQDTDTKVKTDDTLRKCPSSYHHGLVKQKTHQTL